MRERAACEMRRELIGVAFGLFVGVAFAADASFDGTLRYTRADGVECGRVPARNDGPWFIALCRRRTAPSG